MLGWLWRRLGLVDRDGSHRVEYDPVYGLPRKAFADWIGWNPHLAAEHELLADRRARGVRPPVAGKEREAPAQPQST